MAVLGDLLGALAQQDVDRLARPEGLPSLALQPQHGGQQHLGRDGGVPGLRRGQAGVAVAAGFALLPEVGQQPHPPALDGLAQRQHRVQLGREHPAVGEVAVGGLDHLPLLDDVGQPVGQPRGGGQPVPAGAPGLLVVALYRLGQVQVGHEPDVGFVDAHAERDGRHHHQPVLAEEPGLVTRAGPLVQPRVVGQRRDALGDQELRGLLHRRPGQAVDDPGVPGVLGAQQVQQLLARLALRRDAVLDVGSVETGDDVQRVVQLQPGADLGVRGPGRRRRQGDPGHLGPALVQHRQREVVGPEVVPPLRHAMRLVDREQGDPAPLQQSRRGGGAPTEGLRGHVQQVELLGQERLLDHPALGPVLAGVEERSADADRAQRIHLVLHEGDER